MRQTAFMQTLSRRLGRSAILLVSLGALIPTVANADSLVMSVQSVMGFRGQTGSFDVLLTNPVANSASFTISGFSFEVDTTDTDITFQGTTVNTGAPYIFAGHSAFGPTLNLDSPGQAMDGSDIYDTPNGFVTLAPGNTVGLGHVTFTVSGTAAFGTTATLTLNSSSAFTSLSDQNGNAVPFTTLSGAIVVVPEPSAWLLMAGALPMLWLLRRKPAPATATRDTRNS